MLCNFQFYPENQDRWNRTVQLDCYQNTWMILMIEKEKTDARMVKAWWGAPLFENRYPGQSFAPWSLWIRSTAFIYPMRRRHHWTLSICLCVGISSRTPRKEIYAIHVTIYQWIDMLIIWRNDIRSAGFVLKRPSPFISWFPSKYNPL